jgi:uncharacterized protein with FMN-binding domain
MEECLMAKMSKKWIALYSTVIGAVYTAGYFSTEAQANALQVEPVHQTQQAQPAKQVQQAHPTQQVQQAHPTQQTRPKLAVQSQVVHTKVSQIKRKYKEGTFTGTGSNRRGSIQVAVKIKNDKITDVTIRDYGMHYSESDIDGLPDEVVQKQSASVNNVSGATYSTQAFQDAIQDALTQAQNA